MEWIKSISVWLELYLDPCCEASGTKTRLYSLDRGIHKPGMALTLRNSVYLMLKTKTLIETLIEWVTWHSQWFLLYLGRYWGYPPEPGSCFYMKDIVFPIPSLYRTGGARMSTRYFLIIQWRPLRRPPNDADWEGGMVIIQKVGWDQKKIKAQSSSPHPGLHARVSILIMRCLWATLWAQTRWNCTHFYCVTIRIL